MLIVNPSALFFTFVVFRIDVLIFGKYCIGLVLLNFIEIVFTNKPFSTHLFLMYRACKLKFTYCSSKNCLKFLSFDI